MSESYVLRNIAAIQSSQSHKLSPSLTSPAAVPATRRRSSSTASASKLSNIITRSSTHSTLAQSRSAPVSAFSPQGSPAATRQRRPSSSASASAAAFALTRALRAKLYRTDTDAGAYYDSDESWDDGELDPMSEFALPDWRFKHAARTTEDVRTASLSQSQSPSPGKKPLIMEATLRGWTAEPELPSNDSTVPAHSPTVRKFSDNFAPPAKHLSPAATTGSPRFHSPKSPFMSPESRAKNEPPAASSTGRGSPMLFSSRPAHTKQASSLSLAHTSSFEPDASSLLPPFKTPPIQTADLPALFTDSEVEERLEDELSPRAFIFHPAQNRSHFAKEPKSDVKEVAGKRSVLKKKSSGSLSTSDISYPTSHQVVNLRAVKADPRPTIPSPRALSFDGKSLQLGLVNRQEIFETSSQQTPRHSPAQVKNSVSISSIRKASNAALGRTFGSNIAALSDSEQLARTQKTAVVPSRPSTPPPFSDLITMPTPTVRQSKAERILGLSAGAAAAIRGTATTTAQVNQPPSAPSLVPPEKPNPYVRVRSPFELLPRAVTPQPPPSGFKKCVGASASGQKKQVAFAQPIAPPAGAPQHAPLLSYDPRRRPKQALPSMSQESLPPSDGSGGSASSPDTPDSLQKTTELPWVPATLASLSRSLPPSKTAPSIIRKLSAKRPGMAAAASFGKAIMGGAPLRPRRASDVEVIGIQEEEEEDSPDSSNNWSAGEMPPKHRKLTPVLPPGQTARSSPRFELRDHQLLPPLPKRMQAPAFAPPMVLQTSPAPAPIKKDTWLARQKANYAQTISSAPGAMEQDHLEPVEFSTGPMCSSESLPFMDEPCWTSEDSPSDAKPSSPEIDAGRRRQLGEECMAEEAAEAAVVQKPTASSEEPHPAVVVPAAIKPVPAFHATVLGTQLIPASDLDGRRLYDLDGLPASVLLRKRRVIVQLMVKKETYWTTKEIFFANGAADADAPRLASMIKNTADMAEKLFGPDDFEEEPAKTTLKARSSLAPSQTPMSDTASFEFNLQHPFHLGCSGASKSTLEVDLTPTSANYHLSGDGASAGTPSPISSPSSMGSTIVFTPKTPANLRASNTSMFARALGPLVVQQAAYIARLRIQHQEDESCYDGQGHRIGWGGPSDVSLEENEWDAGEEGSGFSPRSNSNRERRALTLSRVEEEDQFDSRCSMSSWIHGRSPSPDLFPSRRPSEMVYLVEEEAEGYAAVPHITIEPAAPSIVGVEEEDPEPTSPRPDRMHILITLKLDRDPNPYPSILAALCKDPHAEIGAHAQDIDMSSSESGHSAGHLRSSVLLQPVDVGTISRRRRGKDLSAHRSPASLSSASDSDAGEQGRTARRTWASTQEKEEAAWLGLV
ncbi:unnamed protein product [Tilletia controversa]|nr:unnamed protein product [Tilletia controversa]